MSEPDLVELVGQELERLRGFVGDETPSPTGGCLTSAVALLRSANSHDTTFVDRLDEISTGMMNGRNSKNRQNVIAAVDVLEQWLALEKAGFMTRAPYAVRVRQEAATDLMEQVHTLLDDGKVHPAAPVMLAGAALEEVLRALALAGPVQPKGKPGMESYANALRTAEIISQQQRKDITSVSGLRNKAAHGDFDGIQLTNAQLMAQQVNLLLSQLSA
jgi:hypothetical protein